MLAGNADRFANKLTALLENAKSAFADVLGGNAREFLVAHGHGDSQLAVRAPFRSHAEVDKVVPVKRRIQYRHWQTERRKELIGLTLGVEVRHFIFALQGRHAIIVKRHPSARVFERRPNDVLETGMFCGLGHGAGLCQLLLGRKMRPEKRYAERAISSSERPF